MLIPHDQANETFNINGFDFELSIVSGKDFGVDASEYFAMLKVSYWKDLKLQFYWKNTVAEWHGLMGQDEDIWEMFLHNYYHPDVLGYERVSDSVALTDNSMWNIHLQEDDHHEYEYEDMQVLQSVKPAPPTDKKVYVHESVRELWYVLSPYSLGSETSCYIEFVQKLEEGIQNLKDKTGILDLCV